MKFCIKDFFSKCDQIRRNLQIWLHLLKKSLMQNLIFYAMINLTGLQKTNFEKAVEFLTHSFPVNSSVPPENFRRPCGFLMF